MSELESDEQCSSSKRKWGGWLLRLAAATRVGCDEVSGHHQCESKPNTLFIYLFF